LAEIEDAASTLAFVVSERESRCRLSRAECGGEEVGKEFKKTARAGPGRPALQIPLQADLMSEPFKAQGKLEVRPKKAKKPRPQVEDGAGGYWLG